MATDFWKDYEPEPHKGLSEHLAQATNGRVRIDPVTGNVGIGTAPVQEPVATLFGSLPVYDTPPTAQRQCNWPTCQSEEYQQSLAEQLKQELVTGAAQPAVPDAIIEAGESPEFRDGWNECRETMLQMLKARNT
jgi:hypothetical protein